jgi:ribosomal protein L7/L12
MRYRFTFVLEGEGETEEQCLSDAMDAFAADPGVPSETVRVDQIDPAQDAEWQELARHRKPIEASKVYRRIYGCGLKEAHDAVGNYIRNRAGI